MPWQMRFLPFIWLYLWFYWISFGEIFQNFRRDTNFKHKKVGFLQAFFFLFLFFRFLKICRLPLQKNRSDRFPWKQSSNLSTIFFTTLPNFTEFHRRKREKIHCQFCFLCSCWLRHKISKNTDIFLWARRLRERS